MTSQTLSTHPECVSRTIEGGRMTDRGEGIESKKRPVQYSKEHYKSGDACCAIKGRPTSELKEKVEWCLGE